MLAGPSRTRTVGSSAQEPERIHGRPAQRRRPTGGSPAIKRGEERQRPHPLTRLPKSGQGKPCFTPLHPRGDSAHSPTFRPRMHSQHPLPTDLWAVLQTDLQKNWVPSQDWHGSWRSRAGRGLSDSHQATPAVYAPPRARHSSSTTQTRSVTVMPQYVIMTHCTDGQCCKGVARLGGGHVPPAHKCNSAMQQWADTMSVI